MSISLGKTVLIAISSDAKATKSFLSYKTIGFAAAKPMVLYERKDLVALASEEIAIRTVLPKEIDTYDPYEGEVKVWQA